MPEQAFTICSEFIRRATLEAPYCERVLLRMLANRELKVRACARAIDLYREIIDECDSANLVAVWFTRADQRQVATFEMAEWDDSEFSEKVAGLGERELFVRVCASGRPPRALIADELSDYAPQMADVRKYKIKLIDRYDSIGEIESAVSA